jgi:hypothetical protein
MLFTNALAMLTIRGEIRRLGHTRQPSDVRRTTTEMTCHPACDSIASCRQRGVRCRVVGNLLR